MSTKQTAVEEGSAGGVVSAGEGNPDPSQDVGVVPQGQPQALPQGVCHVAAPVNMQCTAGQRYYYCTCGVSKSQPYCDSSHVQVRVETGVNFVPLIYTPTTTGTVSFCGCRSSKRLPLCDGTHTSHPEYKPETVRLNSTACASCPNQGAVGDIEDLAVSKPKAARLGPFEINVQAGRVYYYCACGGSKNQPFCDGGHGELNERIGTSFEPVMYEAEADGVVPFCGCRTSKAPPICDSSHTTLSEKVEAAAGVQIQPKIAFRGQINIEVQGGTIYSYCTCGHSQNQPFCDGSHRGVNAQYGKNVFTPSEFQQEESGTVGFCGCRHSKLGAVCDGAHVHLPRDAGGRRVKHMDFQIYTVLSKQQVNHDTVLIAAKCAEGTDAPGSEEVSFHFSVRVASGKVRPYTPISYNADTGTVLLLVKLVANGAVSPALCGVSEGDSLEVKGPTPGAFHWSEVTPKKLLLVCAGTGIAPIFQVAEVACIGKRKGHTVRLIYSNKTAADVLLKQQLDDLKAQHPEVLLSIDYCITREEVTPDSGLHAGRVTHDLFASRAEGVGQVVICGTPAFNSACTAFCKTLEMKDEQIVLC